MLVIDMASRKIKWGILGTGKAASNIAECFSQVTNAELIGVSSRDLEKAKNFALAYKIENAYGSYEDMLKNSNIDIIFIATPHHRHKDDCIRALTANKAVLCEKPFTLNSQEAEEVISVAREKNLFCMEGMWMRFFPLIQETKSRIESGEVGVVKSLKADFGYPTSFDPKNRFFASEMGGGSLLDRGIYTLSLAYYLLGKPASVKTVATIGETGVDEQSAYLLQYENGAIAELSSSLTSYCSNEAAIIGNKGKICIREPFYQPHRIELSYFTTNPTPDKTLQRTANGVKERLKKIHVLRQIYQYVVPTIKKIRNTISLIKTFPGNGYQFEIMEVSQCLLRGDKESHIMPLNETLEISRMMDVMMKRWDNV